MNSKVVSKVCGRRMLWKKPVRTRKSGLLYLLVQRAIETSASATIRFMPTSQLLSAKAGICGSACLRLPAETIIAVALRNACVRGWCRGRLDRVMVV